MELTVKLRNADMPQKGVLAISLPCDDEKLSEQLRMIGIPLGPERNCLLEIDSSPLLMQSVGQRVNADELNFLVKRMDGMDGYELTQYQAAIACEHITDIEAMINLTFNLSNYTVVDDFSDLSAIGKRYFMDERIGVNSEELKATDTFAIARDLLESDEGTVTPFGVVYRHGKEPEIFYTGSTFPAYNFSCDEIMEVGLIRAGDPDDTDRIEWLYLPASDVTIEKALLRLGVSSVEETRLLHTDLDMSDDEFWGRIDWSKESIHAANALCRSACKLDLSECVRLNAICECFGLTSATRIANVIEKLDKFRAYYDVENAESYGIHCIQRSGEHVFDESLSDYYDYKRYGEERMARETGSFFTYGYVTYRGTAEERDLLLGRETMQNAGMTMS